MSSTLTPYSLQWNHRVTGFKYHFLPAYVADELFLVFIEDKAVSPGEYSVKFKFFSCKAGNVGRGRCRWDDFGLGL